MFTLLFGLLAVMVWESSLKLWLRILLVAVFCAVTLLISAPWEIFGVLLILFLHIYRERPKARIIAYSVIIAVWKGLAVMWAVLGGTFDGLVLPDAVLDVAFIMAAYLCMTVFYNGR